MVACAVRAGLHAKSDSAQVSATLIAALPSVVGEEVTRPCRVRDCVSTCASSSASLAGQSSSAEEDEHEGEAEDASARAPTAFAQNDERTRQVFVSALALVLDHLAHMAVSNHEPTRVTYFHSREAPAISIQDYLARIAKYFQCSDECLVLCLVYIDRIVKFNSGFKVTPLSIHRVLLTSMLVAAKFHDDVFFTNTHYARVGGLRVRELNRLEAHFLQYIKWRLQVSPREYDLYRSHVLVAAQGGSPVQPASQAA